MKAVEATYPVDSRNSEAQAECQYYLPEISCGVCGETWGDTEVWYPSLSLKSDIDTAAFSQDRSVDPKEFTKLRTKLSGFGKRELRLIPGAGIGLVRAKLPKKPTDFVWASHKLLAARRVVEIIEKAGVLLPHDPAIIKSGTKSGDVYVALELDPVRLYDEQTLRETTLKYCRTCGSCEMQEVNPDNLKGLKRYVKKRMPERHGLVRVNESYVTLATEQFTELVQKNGFTGLAFQESGLFV